MNSGKTVEELLALASEEVQDKGDPKLEGLSPVRRFILQENLKAGDYAVKAILVYHRYRKWCKINREKPLATPIFFKEFKLYFTKLEKRDGSYYKLQPDAGFDFSVETTRKAIDDHRKQRIAQDAQAKTKEKLAALEAQEEDQD